MSYSNFNGTDLASDAIFDTAVLESSLDVASLVGCEQDQILYWNEVALEANRVSHTTGLDKSTLGPTLSSRALAIVHIAMHDAFVKTSTTAYVPYLTGLPAATPGISTNAAIAAAAHGTLSKLYPSQKAFFNLKHAQLGINEPGMNDGHVYGLLIAQAILADRANDPDALDDGYAPLIGKGKHRSDPDNNEQGYDRPFYGSRSKGFAITARHELDRPPALSSPEYIAAIKQVRGKGIAPELMGTLPSAYQRRTADETVTGIFWGYDGALGLGTPPRFYNQIIRVLAKSKGNSLEQNARLFALVNVAMADAGILAWDQKYIHNFWRPILGIREHDISMGITGRGNNNINIDCDPSWLPLGAQKTNEPGKKNFTPPFPAYPSGHATFGAAAFHIARLFYGVLPGDRNDDDLLNGLVFVSDELNGISKDNRGTIRPKHVRNFSRGLNQMIEENGFSRVFLGVHWSFDAFALKADAKPDLTKNIGGVPLGLKIAEDIFVHRMSKSSVKPRS
jgi:hypothetical protein